MSNLNARTSTPLAGVFAVVGCDGTGKSTLTADLLTHLQQELELDSETRQVKRVYLGLVSGEAGDKIKNLPFIGVRLEHYLARKAIRAQDMKQALPGNSTAVLMYLLSLWRALQLLRVMRLSKHGVTVIADRYPQDEIPGFHYDGPGLAVQRTNNWLVRKLASREQRLYGWMAKKRPALIIRLNIDADTAFARKPGHALSELQDKIAVMPKLSFNGARVLDIDSRAPYPAVLAAALDGIRQVLCDKMEPDTV